MKIISKHNCRSWLGCLVAALLVAAGLAGCGNNETGEALFVPFPSLTRLPSVDLAVFPTAMPSSGPIGPLPIKPIIQSTLEPTVQPLPRLLGPLVDSDLDIRAAPINLPLELQIPALKVNAPMLGVGLTLENVMDAPIGAVDDPVWRTAYWYRGSGVPGESGTATIAGHVTNLIGPEIFAHIEDLRPGDLIIIHVKYTSIYLRFMVDQGKVYSDAESSTPAVLTQIYGAGPVAGTRPQPSLDGLSHLTLITCSGYVRNDKFVNHTVVYATLSK